MIEKALDLEKQIYKKSTSICGTKLNLAAVLSQMSR